MKQFLNFILSHTDDEDTQHSSNPKSNLESAKNLRKT